MPRYVSKDGVWYSAKEKVGLVNITDKVKVVNGKEVQPGEPYIYEGADRAAEFALYQSGEKNFGVDFRNDPDLINRARQLGYKSVLTYAKAMGYDAKKSQENFEKNAAVIAKHELPERKAETEFVGGGKDMSGKGEDFVGGFGSEELRPRGSRHK